MRKIKIYCLMCALLLNSTVINLWSQTATDYTVITDTNFEAALVGAGVDDKIDGRILNANALKVTKLVIDDEGFIPDGLFTLDSSGNKKLVAGAFVYGTGKSPSIKNVTGIEVFKNLTYLTLSFQQIADINIAPLQNLEFFGLRDQPIANINLSSNKKLKTLALSETSIRTIDVSMLTELIELGITQNIDRPGLPYTTKTGNVVYGQISLDASRLLKLERLYVYGNYMKQGSLILPPANESSLDNFWAEANEFTSFDLTGFRKLRYVILWRNKLTYLNINGIAYGVDPYRVYTESNPNLQEIIVTDRGVADRLEARRIGGLNGLATGVFTSPGTKFTPSNSPAISPPSIVAHPTSRTVKLGNTVDFTVAVGATHGTVFQWDSRIASLVGTTAESALSYRWKKDGLDIYGPASSSSSSIFTIRSVSSTDAGSYTVVVTNSAGSVTSNAAVLTINTAPSFTTQPSSSSGISGSAASFSVVASGTEPLSYQWRKDGTAISGATSSTYSISSTSTSDAGSYTVVVTNSAGSATSNAATLTVTAAATAPSITTQPSAATVTASSAASFSVLASGTPAPTYQWKKDGTSISGATASTYTISSTSSSNAGSYTVVVTNSIGSVTSNVATLTVNTAPSITTQPSAATVTASSAASFSVLASGTPAPTYQWKKDGTSISGATASTYTISSTLASDAGSYSVVVTNSVGSVTSSAAVLTVNTAPSITTQPSASSVTVGGAASFSVVATGTAPLSYQWRRDGTSISGATSSIYTIASTKTTDAGSYTVVVTNSIGAVTSNSAVLTILAPRLYSLAVRTALDAEQILIVGFNMSGGAKNVLLRAAGPTLGAFGVPETMVDPKLDLYSGSTLITSNDNWGGSPSLAATFQAAGAFAFSSTSSRDAALVASIDGGRTAHVSGPTAGAVLVEGYDVGIGDAQRFTSLSARNRVGTGANILIAGFSLAGEGKRNLLIRAIGPTLFLFGVPGVLSDPKLEIYQGSTKIGENDNWSSTLSTTFSSVGAFGLTAGSKDAAITVSLPAGGYTVQVFGADGGVGEALVEIYELP